jgi:hypothetical protein
MNNRNARSQAAWQGKKKSQVAVDSYLETMYMTACCAQDTIHSLFSFKTFESKRRSYAALGTENAKSMFIDRMLDSSVCVDDEGFAFFDICVDGKQLPQSCICHLYGFSRTKLNKRIANFVNSSGKFNFNEAQKQEAQNKPRTTASKKRATPATVNTLAVNWLTTTINSLVDNSPSEDVKYMPCYLKPSDLLPDLHDHLCLFGILKHQLPSLFVIKHILVRDHSTLHFPPNTKLGVCDKCTRLRTNKMLARTDYKKKQVQREMGAHTMQHKSERELFYRCREESAHHPML